ncbi:hypothetical protein BV25DRAFT_1816360 [Artomyces pyxidatus]|uniref:Uncharacterized protein n=1 Tax=Artomyces pyxidatus TaxID=48021 RepID=A0ACB8SEP8_9AGAM|nr:hypothetical protein BV25DRAFT_1816360 [Artomyces pyxidatus]
MVSLSAPYTKVYHSSHTFVVRDNHDRILAIFAARPDGADWDECHQSALEAYDRFAATPGALSDDMFRRGEFATLSAGVSYGGGQTVRRLHCMWNFPDVLEHPSIIRLAGFANGVFANYAPKLYAYYVDTLGPLFAKLPSLKLPFANSIFTAVSFNFGPKAISWCHLDGGNVPFGLCAITSLGSFDATKGGHLYMWELGLVVEFPAGALALITSGGVHHGNTPIQPGERRASLVQYCSGGLFRYVLYGFRTAAKFMRQDRKGKKEFDAGLADRWRACLAFFSKSSELAQDLNEVFGVGIDVE